MIDAHLIRFFEKKGTLESMKGNGLIDRKGKLLDWQRTREIRKAEVELNVHPQNQHIALLQDFNIKKKLREQLSTLANKNLHL